MNVALEARNDGHSEAPGVSVTSSSCSSVVRAALFATVKAHLLQYCNSTHSVSIRAFNHYRIHRAETSIGRSRRRRSSLCSCSRGSSSSSLTCRSLSRRSSSSPCRCSRCSSSSFIASPLKICSGDGASQRCVNAGDALTRVNAVMQYRCVRSRDLTAERQQ
jgi:hypothetical protein